jgi:sugar/nucleoside kinase (ribokinase family)
MHKCIPRITVVSTRTSDHFPGGTAMEGGPARYILEALQRLGATCELVTGELAHVEVVPGPHGETYSIPTLAPIPLPERLSADAVILSPIMREIPPAPLPPIDGLLAIDLQGFVRTPNEAGVVREPADLHVLLERVDIVKAAEAELASLSEESRRRLSRAIVLVTRGADGAVLRRDRSEVVVAGRAVPAPYTVGAGDTFLAAFVVNYLSDRDALKAAERAARFTEAVLAERV